MKKLNQEKELEIKRLLEENVSTKDIAHQLGVCTEIIRRRARLLGIHPFTGKSSVFKIDTAPYDL